MPGTRFRPLLLSTLIPLMCTLSGCGSKDELPNYKCVKSIDGDNESGGEIDASGSIAYVAGFLSIGVFDVSDASNPQVLTPLTMPARVEAIAVSGKRLVAGTAGTLHVFDISNPRAPTPAGDVMQGISLATKALATDGNYAYAGTPSGTIAIFDLTGPSPTLVSQATTGSTSTVEDLLIQGDTLYAASSFGVVALDIGNRKQPVPSPTLELKAEVQGLAFADGRLWAEGALPDLGEHLFEIDVGDRLSPKKAAESGGGCGCMAPISARHITAAHGRILGVSDYGKSVQAWSMDSLDDKADIGGSCLPERYSITSVQAVGEALVISGEQGIGFLAP